MSSMEREVVLDTETTGLSPDSGDRVVEIGCIELVNHTPTGNLYHTYLNPERKMSEGAFQVSGLSDDFLSDKPRFAEIADDVTSFLENAPIVAHNASFDIDFINNELNLAGLDSLQPPLVVDTLLLARKKFPGAQASLDALCRRFDVDNSRRQKHGALLDAELLAEVYLELIGGRQPNLSLPTKTTKKLDPTKKLGTWPKREFAPSEEEKEAHSALLAQLKNAIWLR